MGPLDLRKRSLQTQVDYEVAKWDLDVDFKVTFDASQMVFDLDGYFDCGRSIINIAVGRCEPDSIVKSRLLDAFYCLEKLVSENIEKLTEGK